MKRRDFIAAMGGATGMLALADPLGQSAPLRVLFVSDFHAREDLGVPEAMDLLATRVNRMKPDFLIGGGDYIHGGFRSTGEVAQKRFDVFRRFLDQVDVPAYWLIGNHDFVNAVDAEGNPTAGDPTALFKQQLGVEKLYGAFDLGGWEVITLQTVQVMGGEVDYRGWVDDEQLQWLTEHLKQVPVQKPLMLLSHIPLRSTFLQVSEHPMTGLRRGLVVENANEVLALFAPHNLKVVLQGHLHLNERIYFNDTAFIMGGAVCGRWWQGPNLGTAEGFAELKLDPSPSIAHTYHKYR